MISLGILCMQPIFELCDRNPDFYSVYTFIFPIACTCPSPRNNPFYKIWNEVTVENHGNYKNFKTSGMGPQWPSLRAIPTNAVKEYYLTFAKNDSSKENYHRILCCLNYYYSYTKWIFNEFVFWQEKSIWSTFTAYFFFIFFSNQIYFLTWNPENWF